MTLIELLKKRDDLTQHLTETEQAINSHRDTISARFGGSLLPFLQRVTFVKATSGWTDSRKNPAPYSGFLFRFDDELYEVRSGGNWCSSFTEVNKALSSAPSVRNVPNWEDYDWDDVDGAIEKCVTENPNNLPGAVACALLVLNGITG